ncbi:MAG: RNA methyltransferase [Chloroflexi bacterium]|nr:RNA methyltransferase [Chloroflexota bacterium]
MITSLSNDRVKRVRALQSRRSARRKVNQFVIEGSRLLDEAVKANIPIVEVYYTESFAESDDGVSLLEAVSVQGAAALSVDEAVMIDMSDTKTPQGILAVLPFLALPAPDQTAFALIVDGISDPGNLGTIMRSAVAAGVPLMITTSGTVDLYNPKVLRGAMGAHFYLATQQLSWPGIANRLDQHAIFVADSYEGAAYYQIDWTQPCALIVSEEAHGASQEARATAHAAITIPMIGPVDSLNVAMASSVLLFERVRQLAQAGL